MEEEKRDPVQAENYSEEVTRWHCIHCDSRWRTQALCMACPHCRITDGIEVEVGIDWRRPYEYRIEVKAFEYRKGDSHDEIHLVLQDGNGVAKRWIEMITRHVTVTDPRQGISAALSRLAGKLNASHGARLR